MRAIAKNSFFHLVAIYLIIVLAISLGFLWKYSLKLDIFAMIIALLGIAAISGKKIKPELAQKTIAILLLLAIAFALFTRAVPYLNNSVPLGYDAGIYKYVFEEFQNSLLEIPEKNLDSWVRGSFPSGLPILADIFYLFGFKTEQILIPLFIILSSLTILPVYLVSKKYFGKEAGVISALLYSVSLTQLNVFWFMYYKNVLAISLMLFAVYFIDDRKHSYLPVIFAAAVGFFHRPTFLLLMMAWCIYLAISFKDRKLLLSGISGILATGALLLIAYSQRLNEIIITPFEGVVESFVSPGAIGAGTFYNLFSYQFISLVYLPFAILGFFVLVKRKDWGLLFIWSLVNAGIVIFRVMFYNRFIIHLDIAAIILAGGGIACTLLNGKGLSKKVSLCIILLMLAAGMVSSARFSYDMKPLLSEQQLESVKKIRENTENESFVMATAGHYSPWVLGYSGRKTIAPGMFSYDNWTFEEWSAFWQAGNESEIKPLMDRCGRPLYVFIGKHPSSAGINPGKFSGACFEKIFEDEGGTLYRYAC